MSLHNPKKEIKDLIRNISTTYAYSRSGLFVCCDRGDVCAREKGRFSACMCLPVTLYVDGRLPLWLCI